MTHRTTYLESAILLLMTCLALACGDSEGGATVDSQLPGVYLIDQYRLSTEGCAAPTDAAPPASFLALYSFASDDDPDDPLLLGRFCGSVDGCRAAIRDFPEVLNPGYAFMDGNDASGWRGWSISGTRLANDRCAADVQAHVLTSVSGNAVNIETKGFSVVFDGEVATDGTSELTCENAAAIEALRDDPPCTEIYVVDATFEAGL